MTGKALAKAPPPPTGLNPIEVAEHFSRCGWFKDASDPSKAVVKILAGQEMGIGPMAAMQGINIIQGKPTLSANLLATQVKRHPAYDYRVKEHDDKGCGLEFFQNGESIGTSSFTLEDAKKASLTTNQTWQKYPKAMMFARALSQGVRWYCPDVTAGSPAYVPEELGAEVNEDGEPTSPVEPDAEPAAYGPSGKQLAFLLRLLKEQGVSSNNQELVRDWAEKNLTGGPQGTCGRALAALKGEDEEKRKKTVEWLLKASGEWAAKQTDLPADMEGLGER